MKPEFPETPDGWTRWIHPLPGYRFECCDCGLVHDLELAIEGESDIPIQSDSTLFRMRRNNRSTGQVRRYRKAKGDA